MNNQVVRDHGKCALFENIKNVYREIDLLSCLRFIITLRLLQII